MDLLCFKMFPVNHWVAIGDYFSIPFTPLVKKIILYYFSHAKVFKLHVKDLCFDNVVQGRIVPLKN